MFSKNDYLMYFKSIKETEELMLIRATELQKSFAGDEEARKLIESWKSDEEKHRDLVKEMIAKIK
jgi:hypothetical protein